MDNQKRNREALVEHIAEQDRILRRRNEQIARQAKQIENQTQNAEEDQRAIDEQDARNYSLAADLAVAFIRADKAEQERDGAARQLAHRTLERDEYHAMHSEQMKTIARLQENPRPLTTDDITDEMVLRFMNTFDTQADGSKPAPTLDHFTVARTTITRAALIMALTPPPSRPEGAEEIEGDLIDIIGTGVLNDSEFDTVSIKLAERGYRKTGGKSAEELQALIRQAEAEGEGADNESLANYLAARLLDPTVKEQS